MKNKLFFLALIGVAIVFCANLAGCTTTPFKIKITPLKIEVNQKAPETKSAAPVSPVDRN